MLHQLVERNTIFRKAPPSEWDRVVALPRHKFVTGATLLQLYLDIWCPSVVRSHGKILLKVILNTSDPNPTATCFNLVYVCYMPSLENMETVVCIFHEFVETHLQNFIYISGCTIFSVK